MGDENRAWVLTCLSVGAVLLARAQASEVARDKVLDAALEHALGLLSASGQFRRKRTGTDCTTAMFGV